MGCQRGQLQLEYDTRIFLKVYYILNNIRYDNLEIYTHEIHTGSSFFLQTAGFFNYVENMMEY